MIQIPNIKYKILNTGFTLIEVLVTISIIGLLASLTLVSFGSSQKSARDVQRKSDLKQYSASLEGYANQNNSLYPERATTVSAQTTLCTDLGMTSCPEDPKNIADPTYAYYYQSDGASTGTAKATKFVLWAKIERATDYWVICSSGVIGAKAQSGFSVSGGNCPI